MSHPVGCPCRLCARTARSAEFDATITGPPGPEGHGPGMSLKVLDPEAAISFVRAAVLEGTTEVYDAGGKSRDVVILLSPAGATYCARPEPAHLDAWFQTLREQGERSDAYAAVVILDVPGIGPHRFGAVLVTLEHRDLARNPSWSAMVLADGKLAPWQQHPGSLAKVGGSNQLLTRRAAGALA